MKFIFEKIEERSPRFYAWLVLGLLFLISMSGYAQSNNNCPDNAAHPKNNSEESLEHYLNSNSFESARAIFNLPDLQNAQIELLTGSSDSCFELNNRSQNFVNVHPNEGYTYYKVSNYYFIVNWYSVNTTARTNIVIYNDQYDLIHSQVL